MSVCAWYSGSGRAHRSPSVGFLLLQHFSYFLLSSPHRCFISVFVCLYVLRDVALMTKKPFMRNEQMYCVYHGRTNHMGYTYLNLLDSPEILQILATLTAVIKPLLPNFLGRAIVILNFVRQFWNFIADSALVEKYNVSLKTLLQQGISEPEFYGELVYRFRKIVGRSNFSEQLSPPWNHLTSKWHQNLNNQTSLPVTVNVIA